MLSAEMYQGSDRENRRFILSFILFSFPVLRDCGRKYKPKNGNSLQGHTFHSGPYSGLSSHCVGPLTAPFCYIFLCH